MKLLFIAQDFPNPLDRNCGIFNQYLVRAIAQNHEVRVICPVQWIGALRKGRKDAAKIAEQTGVPVHYPIYFYTPKVLRSRYGSFMWRSVKGTVNRIVKTWRPDAVVGYWVHPDGYVANQIARKLNIPSGVIVGGSDVLLLTQDATRRQQVQEVLRRVDAVFAVNEHLKQRVQEMGASPDKVHVWEQGVDDRFCPGDQDAARRRLDIPEGPVAVWVGRMVQVKGLEVLVEAARILRQAMDFRLYLVGEGPQRGQLEAQVAAAGLQNNVRFAGLQEHDRLADWYRAADLMVLSSWSEGLPNVLRESLACGTPFVATRVGGIAEIAGDRADDWLVKAGEPVAFAAAMQRSLTTPQALPETFHPIRWLDSANNMMETMKAAHKQPAYNPLGIQKPRSFRQLARKFVSKALPSRVYLSGPSNTGKACLTFDDGPHPIHTPHLLDILRDNGIPATFFVVGKNAERYPDIVRRMVEEGHTVGHHTYSHGEPAVTSAKVLMEEVNKTCDLLMPLVGESPKLFRPPQGKLTFSKLIRLWLAGQYVVLWDLDPKDFACTSSTELAERMRRYPPSAGNIVLLHDSVPHIANVLPNIIASARKRGVSFTTLREWVH